MTTASRPDAAQAIAARVLRSSADSVEEMDPALWEQLFEPTPSDATDFERRQAQAMRLLAEAVQAVGFLTTGLTMHTEEAARACMWAGEKALRSPIIRHLDHCPGHPTTKDETTP